MKQASKISSIIKEIRKKLNLSQAEFAEQLYVSLPTVNRWEKDKTTPDGPALNSIEKYLLQLGPEFLELYDRFLSAKQSSAFDIKLMEGLLWKAACSIRGEQDAPKFKDYLLPLIFIKRLSDVFEDEVRRLTETYEDEATARTVLEADHSLVRFYIPQEATWAVISGRQTFNWPEGKKPKTLGEQLTYTIRSIARFNPSLQGVIDIVDYNETRNGEREISDQALSRVIEILSDPKYRMGLKDVAPDFLGQAYEYLLRKFAESQGQSAGEFFTPMEVGKLMASIVQPEEGEEVYDPCCGSAGLLIKCELALLEKEKNPNKPLKLYGQEMTGSSFAIARMNMVLHDMEGEIVRGNSMTNPKFLDNSSLEKFDIIVTNPMWNQKSFDQTTYENDPYDRFSNRGGFAPGSSADWAWFQHILASLNEKGRAAVVIDTGAASRGSGNENENKEKLIRQWFVEHDLIEGVILLPDNLFYNTTAAGLIIVLNCKKSKERKGKVILINAGMEFLKGRPKNYITPEGIKKISDAFHAGKDAEKFVKVVSIEEIAKNDFNLSPSRYIETTSATEHRDVQTLWDELANLEVESRKLDGELKEIFTGLGYKVPSPPAMRHSRESGNPGDG